MGPRSAISQASSRALCAHSGPVRTQVRLRRRGAELFYYCPKPQTGGKQAILVLTPLELIARIAARVPPPPLL